MKIFNDPIYGRIEIPKYCVDIIDTPEFQRLRSLKQLGLTSYVFYGATHTRFEHSIGVCWISGEWVKHLQRKQPELGINDKDIKSIQIAALLHDIGHGPFSHTFERFIKRTRSDLNNENQHYNHEDMTIKVIKRLFKNKNSENSDEIETICNIISGVKLEQKSFLAHIVHNTINGLDADKLDYFIRDSQCTSFVIGCDWKRIIYESSVLNDEIVFPQKMVGDIFNVYQIRFRLYKEVYFHKTVSIIENIMLDAMVLADQMGVFKFRDSNGNIINLAHSIDDVASFLDTQDDIIGQMERSGIKEILDRLNMIKTRNFKDYNVAMAISNYNEVRCAHYGMLDVNPLDLVTFIDKQGQSVKIDPKILQTITPSAFTYIL